MDSLKEEFYKTRNEVRIFKRRPLESIEYLLSVTSMLFVALMFWKLTMLATGTDSPVVVVLSGSMEPAFYRGDILFLMKKNEVNSGDIVVFKLEGREIPIVHRALSLHEGKETFSLLTKGDNNRIHDRSLYPSNKNWLNRKDVIGTVLLKIPKVGILSIYLNEYPALKHAIVAFAVILMLSGKG
ncbi:signal peptidase [Theileria orientalis]|uniref:Signal peptidase complex catalytic subunit SEC11 n=1 Tax=Theileria orientalis TaxID=68886 RepID=A0A976XHN3_THEOR|nr:signal peptidase [Theileria orientalis]